MNWLFTPEPRPVALGGYRVTLEDGPELSSSSEGSGDEGLSNASAPGCDPVDAARVT
jgi:hypothetical protein